MSAFCQHDHGAVFDGMSSDYKRRLVAVIAINAIMFFIEMTAGTLAGSQALQADALDFFADSVTYGASLFVIGMPLKTRSAIALAKGVSLAVMGIWVFGSTIYRVFALGVPSAEIMGVIGFLALLANVASVLILMRHKDGDSNVRSVWLCSRNDAIGNVAVMIAALGVWGTATGWPDLTVAAIMAGLFLTSSVKILRQAWREYRTGDIHDHSGHNLGHSHGRGHAHAHGDACCGHDHAHGTPAHSHSH
jgi:Co/Zn/Cd efflux system component